MMKANELKKDYENLSRFIKHSLNELPEGIIYGLNSADEKNCHDLMEDTYRLERLSEKLGIDDTQFIKSCRWHYKKYPDYLNNLSHFNSYKDYILKHHGPVNV